MPEQIKYCRGTVTLEEGGEMFPNDIHGAMTRDKLARYRAEAESHRLTKLAKLDRRGRSQR